MCLGVGLFGFILLEILCASWISCVWFFFSFTKLGTFSVIISSNRSSIPCYLSPPLSTPMMWMFLCFMLAQSFLKLSLFFLILFLFIALMGFFFPAFLPSHWFNPLLHLTYFLLLPVYSWCQLWYFKFLTGYFSWFLYPFSYCCSSH